MFIKIGENVKAHHTVRTYGRNSIGDNSIILDNVLVGVPSTDLLLSLRQVDLNLEHADYEGATIRDNAIIRSGSVIYCNVEIDHHVRTGHKVLVRENTRVGHNVLIGTNVVIDNNCRIGNHVSIQSSVYIPTGTVVGDYVFLGPCANLTNDMYPIRTDRPNAPVKVDKGASLGANCTVLPGVRVGEGAMIAAGAVVTRDVPPWHLAIGMPAELRPLPAELRVLNRIN
jgi:acetyltransferase-like isoleucine patch superfamily enzyme